MKYLYSLVLIIGTTYLVGWCNWSASTYIITLLLCLDIKIDYDNYYKKGVIAGLVEAIREITYYREMNKSFDRIHESLLQRVVEAQHKLDKTKELKFPWDT